MSYRFLRRVIPSSMQPVSSASFRMDFHCEQNVSAVFPVYPYRNVSISLGWPFIVGVRKFKSSNIGPIGLIDIDPFLFVEIAGLHDIP